MIRKAAYQSVVVVEPTINKQNPIHQQPSLFPTPAASPTQRVVHKVPIYLVHRSRSVLVKDLERILGPGGRLESVQAEDGTILLHPPRSIVASTITAPSRPTVIPVRDSKEGRTKYRNEHDKEEEGGEDERENFWFIHPTFTTATAPPPPAFPSLPLIESQADTAATITTASSSILSCPCSCSGSCSNSTSTSSLPQLQQEENEQGEKSRGELHHHDHDQQANKGQTTRAEPPTPTQMTTRSKTFSEQQQNVQFEPKVEHQTRSFRPTSGQSTGDPWTRSRIKRSTLQHEDEEEHALGAVAIAPCGPNGERGSGEGDNDGHGGDGEAVEKRGEDVNRNKDVSVLASSPSSSFSFPPPPSPNSIPTIPSQSSMASTSTSSTSLPSSPSSLPTSTSTDTMMMRQQLLEMANALVLIADRGDDVEQDRGHARTLALQVLESYTLALTKSTSLPSSSDKTNASPTPSLDTHNGLITPDATPQSTPQSTPVISSSYRQSFPNTETRPNNDTIVTSPSSTPFSSPSSSATLPYSSPTLVTSQIHGLPLHPDNGTDFCTSPQSSVCSLPPPSLKGQEQCARLDPNIDQQLHAGSCMSLPSASQPLTALLPPTPSLPTTIPDARKGSKDGNKTRLSRMLNSNSVKNPFGSMFGSTKSNKPSETTMTTTLETEEGICGSEGSLTTSKEQRRKGISTRKGSADSGGNSSQGSSSNSSGRSPHRGSSGHEEDNHSVLGVAPPAFSPPSSSTTPWYRIQQRRRESRANSASESGSGSGSNSNSGSNNNSNSNSSDSSSGTPTTTTGREPESSRFSVPFGSQVKSLSTAETRQRALVSHVPSLPTQQQQQQQQPHAQHHTHQHSQHPQQYQQPPLYSSSAHSIQRQVQPQPQRHLYSADARIGGGRSVTRTATGSFFDSVSDSDSDEDIAHPAYLQHQRQCQPHYQPRQLLDHGRALHRMSYPSGPSTFAAPLVSPTSMSSSSRTLQADPRTQQRLRQQEEEQEQSRSRYQVYDSDEDSDSEDEDDSELEDDEDEVEEEEEERLQRSQRQPYTPSRVLVDPESLEGYIHRFDEAPPPSYHSLIRTGTVAVNPSVAARIESHPLANLSQLLQLLHHFKDHVLDSFKAPAFQINGLSSSTPATPATSPTSPTLASAALATDRHHNRRESWQSRRPQTVASFAYLLIEFEQSGLLFPPNVTLFLNSTASSPASLFCRSEQDWLAKTGNATTVSQLAMALLALEQTCQDQAMMDLNRWYSSCDRDRWIVQVQSLSTTV